MALSWFFEDERDNIARTAAKIVSDHNAVVPPLFRFEIQNMLVGAVRHKRITAGELAAYLEAVDDLQLQVDDEILKFPHTVGVEITQRFTLSAYDAAYLELAVRRSLPLMTRDQKLMRAAGSLNLLWNPKG